MPIEYSDTHTANKKQVYLFQESDIGLINIGINCLYCDYDNEFTITK